MDVGDFCFIIFALLSKDKIIIVLVFDVHQELLEEFNARLVVLDFLEATLVSIIEKDLSTLSALSFAFLQLIATLRTCFSFPGLSAFLGLRPGLVQSVLPFRAFTELAGAIFGGCSSSRSTRSECPFRAFTELAGAIFDGCSSSRSTRRECCTLCTLLNANGGSSRQVDIDITDKGRSGNQATVSNILSARRTARRA